jgi:hypothetical protein
MMMMVIIGRLSFNLTKVAHEIWPRIMMYTEEVPKSQIQIWWEMKRYYKKDMEEFVRLLEEKEHAKERVVNRRC